MEDCKISNLYNLDESIAKPLLEKYTYPWEVLPHIEEFILELGKSLNKEEYEQIGENVWIHKTAKVYKCAFIRKNAIIGKDTVVGNSTELKNVILFNNVQVPHYNYVGDSILGFKSHMGAGSITSNIKSDKKPIIIKDGEQKIETGMKKIGAMVGDNVEVGCGSILNPGSIIGKNTNIYPLSSVRGVVKSNSIYKNQNEIVGKQNI